MVADDPIDLDKPHLLIRVLDGFSLEDASGHRITIPNRKACGVLAYLSLNQGSCETRERLAGLFWSDSGENQARASLRQCLKQLRVLFNEMNFAGFSTGRQEIAVEKGAIRVDLELIAEKLAHGDVPAGLIETSGLTDRILYGYENLDPSLTAWLHVLRQNWYDRLVDSLQTILRSDEISADTHRRAAEALVKIDATHEEAQRFLIALHARDGNIAAALRQYKLLWDLLDDEYDMEPADKTEALIAEIKSGTYHPHDAVALSSPVEAAQDAPVLAGPLLVPEPVGLPIIGVWSFVKGGSWNQEDYLIEGFRRELIASLVRFREWVVVEGQEDGGIRALKAAPIQGRNTPPDYVLEGVYLEDSDNIRLVITLKELASQRYIWSEQIALTLEGWFMAQQEIVRRISVALNIYLSVERLTRFAGRPDVSLAIYDRWLRGQELSFRWRLDTCERASTIFRSIINEAPNYAPAYSSLVQIENSRHLIAPGIFRLPQREAETYEFARAAVEIDPLDSRTQLCLAWSHAMNGQFNQAEFYFRLALKLNENDPWSMVSAALGLAYCGQTGEAEKLADRALRLDMTPSPSHWSYQAGIRFLCGDYAACVEAAERAGNTIYYLPAWKAAALCNLDRVPEAETEARHFLDLVRSNWCGDLEPHDETIAQWLLHSFPIKRSEARKYLRSGIRAAGIPVPD